MCGRATEECDATCGGAGCGDCGGVGCNGARDFSKEALDRSQKTQDILNDKATETSDLLDRLQVCLLSKVMFSGTILSNSKYKA